MNENAPVIRTIDELKKIDPKVEHLYKVVMTKPLADYLLSKNLPTNRNISRPRVEEYRKYMLRGEWLPSAPLMMSSNGFLIDGQTRLSAIPPGMEIEMFLMTGLSAESAETLDQGRNRNALDIATIRGVGGLTAQHISLLRMMLIFRFPDQKVAREDGFSTRIIAGILEALPEVKNAIDLSLRYSKGYSRVRYAPVSAVVARAFLASGSTEEMAQSLDYFLYCFQTRGVFDYEGEIPSGIAPLNACRLRSVYDEKASKGLLGGTDRKIFFTIAQSAVSSYLAGRESKKFKRTFRNIFPVPLLDQLNLSTLKIDKSITLRGSL